MSVFVLQFDDIFWHYNMLTVFFTNNIFVCFLYLNLRPSMLGCDSHILGKYFLSTYQRN